MATQTSIQSSNSPDVPGVPFRHTSHNYTEAQATSSSPSETKPMEIKIPDGRRNSFGEKMPSPVESWKPNFARRQSWNREDLKREHVASQLGVKKGEGMGTGFTEVEGT